MRHMRMWNATAVNNKLTRRHTADLFHELISSFFKMSKSVKRTKTQRAVYSHYEINNYSFTTGLRPQLQRSHHLTTHCVSVCLNVLSSRCQTASHEKSCILISRDVERPSDPLFWSFTGAAAKLRWSSFLERSQEVMVELFICISIELDGLITLGHKIAS